MDPTALLIGALLLVIGLAVGVLIGRSHPGQASPGAGVEVAALLAPASDALLRVEQRLQEVERDRVGAYAGLREQVAALHRSSSDLGMQTRALVGALRAPTGPRQVGRGPAAAHRRVGRHGGALRFRHPGQAQAFGGDGSEVRPDMIIRFPADGRSRWTPRSRSRPGWRRWTAWTIVAGRADGGACQGAARSCRRVGGEGLLAQFPTGPRVRRALRPRGTAAGCGPGHRSRSSPITPSRGTW